MAFGDDHIVGAQGPLAVDDISEHEPDFTVLPDGPDYFNVLLASY